MTQYMLRTDRFQLMGRNPPDLEGQVIVTGESFTIVNVTD